MRLPTLLPLGAALLSASVALAAGQATLDEAKAMAIQAADNLRANGPEKAFQAFNVKDGPWHDRDLYVFVQNDQEIMVMNGNNPGLVGKNVAGIKDPNGRSISAEMRAVKDAGWIDFSWQNPATMRIEPKRAYVVRVGDYLLGVGAYTQ